ncbi:MAG TPA: hypothetical protein DIW20_03640 [Rhodospirillaceae bacterium]|nr:hypothetical protein [Rhodospirillaceae bacterium]
MKPRNTAEEILQSFIDRCMADMRPDQAAIVDAMVMMQLARRAPNFDLKLEMRLIAEKHRKASPYLCYALRALADTVAANVTVLPINPAMKQEHNDAPKRH